MKKISLLILLTSLMQVICSQDKCCDPSTKDYVNNFKMKDGATWLKDFNIYSPKSSDKPNNFRYSMNLNEKCKYRFVVKNSPKFPGKMKISLINERDKVAISELTTNNNAKTYDFTPTKTGAYQLIVDFPDGKEGCGTIAIFFVRTM